MSLADPSAALRMGKGSFFIPTEAEGSKKEEKVDIELKDKSQKHSHFEGGTTEKSYPLLSDYLIDE